MKLTHLSTKDKDVNRYRRETKSSLLAVWLITEDLSNIIGATCADPKQQQSHSSTPFSAVNVKDFGQDSRRGNAMNDIY